MPTDMKALIERVDGLHDKVATCHPKLSRGRVWCATCGATQAVNTAGALRHGWPKCCGYTMTIDNPEERAMLSVAGDGAAASDIRGEKT